MTKHYRTREGEATGVDTRTALTTLGSEAAPGPLMVPAGVARLLEAIVSCAADGVAVGSASAIVRLEGGGLPTGPEVITVGAYGNEKTGGVNISGPARRFPLDVPVTSGNEILLYGEMCGVDIGSIHFTVTLVFAA